ncbi:MAG: WhiB family transcriptional regulator [Actinomycetota bacterium]|nr:WhiB family transcriptional regulator [Actinomycetota bacterium]
MADVAKLPTPVAEHWDWQIRAACRGLNAAMFFHPDNERGKSRRRREAQAKVVCARCPVTRECLRWALSVREPYGVWGGLSAAEREELLGEIRISADTR